MWALVKISELAKVLRSKNAGPFLTTIDIFFESKENYERVKSSGVITKELVAKLYGIPLEDVMGPLYYEPALGIKVTIVKPGHMASGDPECKDTLGAQQHVPFLGIDVP